MRPLEEPLRFAGARLTVYACDDGLFWIRLDHLAAALACALPNRASYYARYHSPWTTCVVPVDGEDRRLMSFAGAAMVVARVKAPRAAEFAALLDWLDDNAAPDPPRSAPSRAEGA